MSSPPSSLQTAGRLLQAFHRDLRHAARGLLARRTYSLVMITTLALVIGAATAILAVTSATMIRPLPFPDGERLVQLFTMPPGTGAVVDRNPLHARVFHRLRAALRQVDSLAGVWERDRVLGGDGEPETVAAAGVSAGAFELFGGAPMLGRAFSESEDVANAKVAVLSHGLWLRRFGGDPSVLGTMVTIDRQPHEVVGVMPRTFGTAFIKAEVWTPLAVTEASPAAPSTFIETFGRLRPGGSVRQAAGEVAAAMQEVVAETPAVLTGWSAGVTSLREAQFGEQRPSLWALLAGVLALALIAAANLANLSLARVTARRGEIALRALLGAGRTDILRLQFSEGLLLAGVGGLAGILLGAVTLPLVLALDPAIARKLGDVRVDWRVQFAAVGVALLVSTASGLAPLWRALRGDLAKDLADAGLRTAGSRREHRARRMLVAAECAIAVALLGCGALLLNGFAHASRVAPGFEPRGVLGAQLRLSEAAYPTEEARARFVTRVLEQVRSAPGVTAAGTTLNPFVPQAAFVTLIHIDGKPTADGRAHTVQFRRVSSGYFDTLRIARRRGRDFDASDTLDSPSAAMISRSFAERFWPGEDPVGKRLRRGTNPRLWTVVGVVDDVRDVSLDQAPAPTLYLPFTQNNVAVTPVSVVVRGRGDPIGLASSVRAAVLAVDPAQPIDHVTTLEQFLADSLGPHRFRSTLLLLLSGLGLAIAGVGIYGVTARAVEERTRELGVRLALGASPRAVLREVVARVLQPVLAGMGAGVVLGGLAGAAMLRTLPNLERVAPWSALPALGALLLVAGLAAGFPARRASRLDPTVALRGE